MHCVGIARDKCGQYSVQRWQLEVTFEEVRAHLGVETQRQWADAAIARVTPALLGLFSWITLAAHPVHPAPNVLGREPPGLGSRAPVIHVQDMLQTMRFSSRQLSVTINLFRSLCYLLSCRLRVRKGRVKGADFVHFRKKSLISMSEIFQAYLPFQ